MRATSFHDDFRRRVDYAAQCIMRGITSRRRDSCYENNDGDLVVTVLVRRSRNNPKLRDAIAKDWGGTFPEHWIETAAKYEHVQTSDIARLAGEMLAKARADFEAWLDTQDATKKENRT
jgi:hypothetical protein